MAGGRLMPMVLAGIRVAGIGWEINRRSQSCLPLLYETASNKKTRGFPSAPHDGVGFGQL